MFAFAFFCDLCRPFLENANVKCEHNKLLPQTPFPMLDANANANTVTCKQGFIDTYPMEQIRTMEENLVVSL